MDLFHFLKPEENVPPELVALQNTMTDARATEPTAALVDDSNEGSKNTGSSRSESDGVGIQQSADQVGCNNVCCDSGWTATYLCQDIWNVYHDYTWNNFNWGWVFCT